MGLVSAVMGRFGYRKISGQKGRRSYAAASTGRLFSSWGTTSTDADGQVRSSLKALRARSRQLTRDNDYAKKFVRTIGKHVVGPAGIILQNRAMQDDGKTADSGANKIIEEQFKAWGKKGNATVCGRQSWRGVQRLVAETVARDGEALVRMVKGYEGNRFRFSLQVIEADHLDHDLNMPLPNGNEIRMGVELNAWGRPVAYHVRRRHPGDGYRPVVGSNKIDRLPADEIVHVFVQERPGQTRGVPWMAAAMTRLNNLGGYEEAEIVAARLGAAKMGFFTTPEGNPDGLGEEDDDNDVLTDVEPGVFDVLPEGYNFTPYDPTHPAGNFGPFVKATLRGIASGLGVSYNGLANDLESVNYSSLRAGRLDEIDEWKDLQAWFIETLIEPVFSAWLEMAMLAGAVTLPLRRIDRFNAPEWQARGWDWVDPLKDMAANLEAINGGLKTRRQALAERGLDLEEVFAQLKEEKELAESLGLTLSETSIFAANPALFGDASNAPAQNA